MRYISAPETRARGGRVTVTDPRVVAMSVLPEKYRLVAVVEKDGWCIGVDVSDQPNYDRMYLDLRSGIWDEFALFIIHEDYVVEDSRRYDAKTGMPVKPDWRE